MYVYVSATQVTKTWEKHSKEFLRKYDEKYQGQNKIYSWDSWSVCLDHKSAARAEVSEIN